MPAIFSLQRLETLSFYRKGSLKNKGCFNVVHDVQPPMARLDWLHGCDSRYGEITRSFISWDTL